MSGSLRLGRSFAASSIALAGLVGLFGVITLAGCGADPIGVQSASSSDGGTSTKTNTITADTTPLFPSYIGGVNLSGAEFGHVPGTFNVDYTYPTHAEVDHFVADGMKLFRFPFMWERLQPTLNQPFDATELARLTDIVSYATGKGAYAVLDPHNSARYRGAVVGANGGTSPTADDFGAFWAQLGKVFASNDKVIFGLTNEPHDMATELWLSDANTAIAAIRQAGANNVIFVPGNGYTGGWDWTMSNQYGTSNAQIMLGVVDPLDKYAFEIHQYFDSDSSGTHKQCSAPVGSARLTALTDWLTQNGKRAFLAELATSTDSSCDGVVSDVLGFLDQHRDVWLGWSWWSAGPWWGANYLFTLEPTSSGADQPIMATLKQHL